MTNWKGRPLSRELSNLLPSASVPGGKGTPNGGEGVALRHRVVCQYKRTRARRGRHRRDPRASVLSIASLENAARVAKIGRSEGVADVADSTHVVRGDLAGLGEGDPVPGVMLSTPMVKGRWCC